MAKCLRQHSRLMTDTVSTSDIQNRYCKGRVSSRSPIMETSIRSIIVNSQRQSSNRRRNRVQSHRDFVGESRSTVTVRYKGTLEVAANCLAAGPHQRPSFWATQATRPGTSQANVNKSDVNPHNLTTTRQALPSSCATMQPFPVFGPPGSQPIKTDGFLFPSSLTRSPCWF